MDGDEMIEFLKASLACYEPAFKDHEDYEDALESLEDADPDEYHLTLTFEVTGKYLTKVSFELESEDEVTKFSLKFKKIGETRVDRDELEKWYEKAEDITFIPD